MANMLYDQDAKLELLQGKKVTIEYSKINLDGASNKATDDVILTSTVMEKLEEINGNITKTNAMLKGRLIT